MSRTPYTPLPLHVLSPVPILTTNFSPENGDNEEEHTVNNKKGIQSNITNHAASFFLSGHSLSTVQPETPNASAHLGQHLKKLVFHFQNPGRSVAKVLSLRSHLKS